jgi:hypothetical protein
MNQSDSRESILTSWLRDRVDLVRLHEDKKRFPRRTGHLRNRMDVLCWQLRVRRVSGQPLEVSSEAFAGHVTWWVQRGQAICKVYLRRE